MGFMDKAMDRAMDKLEARFGDLVKELNDVDQLLARQVAAQERTNELLEQLVAQRGPG